MELLELLKLASRTWKPLSITALILLIMCFVYRTILDLDIFPKLQQLQAVNIISKIINYLFILAIIGFVFGMILYLLPEKKAGKRNEKWEFRPPAPNQETVCSASTINIYNYFGGIPESNETDFINSFQVALKTANEQNYRDAINKFKRLLVQTKDNSELCSLHTQIGHCYYALRQENKASEHYSKALHFAEKDHDKNGIAAAYGNIARTYLSRPSSEAKTRGSNVIRALEIFNKILNTYRKD